MLFNSIHYLIFFPLVAAVFYALPARARALFLVVASCYFYMVFRPEYILILFAVITIDYFSALYIERAAGARKRAALVLSITSNIGILFLFKYYAFAAANLASVSRGAGLGDALTPPALNLILPIGLSFHTFQSLAYVIEVFYGRYRAERHPIRFALYVLFFPQMVAGPIERPQGLLRQLQHLDRPFSDDEAVRGLRLILTGFWCKMLVADNLAPFVDATYSDAAHATAITAGLATLCFSLQIYCDFYGYSLIAIGSARVLGIRLAANFDHPYRAAGFKDFWRRWHISLSSWFRDYVYVPLGGGRGGPLQRDRNLLIVFLLSGLWHGASWTFVVWGLVHAIYVMFENHFQDSGAPSSRMPRWWARPFTFSLVTMAWVFFRAESLTDAFTLIGAIFSKWSTAGADLAGVASRLLTYRSLVNDAAIGLLAYAVLTSLIEPLSERGWPQSSRAMRWSVYYAMIAGLLICARFESRSFIYFQF